ncbi:MAG: Na/Pi cotransporter family protein [Gammaproteobacteria bacterium]|nr:Na/Pi cotransporter family protein [Gammaproteobacteria bacterium]
MTLSAVFAFIGGIGLFLLGMRLMTDGLKVAAGDTLRQILAAATRSRLRGLASGVLITTMVQSSSAVIFATVGFVNAGLLTLYQAIGVIYGSNLGTTLTSWIVALVGFNVNLQALAMPALGVGMGLWVAFGGRRYGALGQALAGFGLFFLGIDVLRDTFADMGDAAALEAWAGHGVFSLLLFMLIGITLTVLMQSSSAALAVTLTAAAGGLIPLTAAAAMVIGANVGTTSTAAFAVLGATAAAKRAASAHVVFNALTAVVAFITLPLLLWLVEVISEVLGLAGRIATSLAIFHTLTKLLGVALMWPLTGALVRQLERRFRSREEDESQPRHLDRNVQAAPALALDAIALELHRMGAMARRTAGDALSSEHGGAERLEPAWRAIESLNIALAEFASGISRSENEPQLSVRLPDGLRVGNYLVDVCEHAVEVSRLQPQIELRDEALAGAANSLRAHAAALLELTAVDHEDFDLDALQAARGAFEAEYQSLKAQLLRAGTSGGLPARRMASALEQFSAIRRIVDQATKAADYLQRFTSPSEDGEKATAEETEATSGDEAA